jgi:5-methylcytosine-specific restriction endonuclease McrA
MDLIHQNKKHKYCINCGKEIHLGNKRCYNCNLKERSKKYKGKGNPRSGIKMSNNLKDKIRKSVLKNPRKSKFTERYLVLHNYSSILCSGKYQKVREKVLERDNYECQLCGKNKGLIVHHIKDKNRYWQLIFEIKNLITLCRNCHSYIHNVGKTKDKFKTKIFKILLQEVNNGRK